MNDETQLKCPKGRATKLIQRLIDEADDLLKFCASLANDESYTSWGRERWDARTKTALNSVFCNPELADEFESDATGSIFRQVGQSEAETFEYRKEAIERGINCSGSESIINHLTSIIRQISRFCHPHGCVQDGFHSCY